jgi:hypothetical protein
MRENWESLKMSRGLGHIPTHVPFVRTKNSKTSPRDATLRLHSIWRQNRSALYRLNEIFSAKTFFFWKSSFVAFGDWRFGSRATDGPKKWECACDRCREGQKKNSQLSLLDNSTIITTIIFYISTIHILHFHNKRFHILLSTCR